MGFKLKLVKRGKCSRGKNKGKPKYVVESHVREESIKKIKAKLDKLIYTIEYQLYQEDIKKRRF